jgi:DNA-formamidopyrimidine glycosylase
MPEGPEVTIVAEGLLRKLKNKEIYSINILSGSRYNKKAPDGYQDFSKSLPTRVTDIRNKGKFLYWTFENGQIMFNTLGMSGIWTSSYQKHASVKITFVDSVIGNIGKISKTIYFVDQRHFGTIKFVSSKKELTDKLNTIGPDLLNDKTMTFNKFKSALKKRPKWNITKALMNQKVISGIGNYLKSESLYHSKISPHLNIEDLNDDRLYKLYQSCRLKIVSSYNQGGVSMRHFKDVDDKKGQYEFSFKVYGRKKDKKGNTIKREITADKRATFWVPSIQF